MASKSADTAAGAQRSPSSRRQAAQDNRLRGPGQRGAPPYEGDLRLQRSIGREPTQDDLSGPQCRTATRSIWVLSPPRRHPGASRPGTLRASAALQTPSTRCSAAAASATSASVRLHTFADPTGGHRIPGSRALLRPSVGDHDLIIDRGARGALGPVLPAEHLVLAGERCSAVPGQDLAELDEFAVGRWVEPTGQD